MNDDFNMQLSDRIYIEPLYCWPYVVTAAGCGNYTTWNIEDGVIDYASLMEYYKTHEQPDYIFHITGTWVGDKDVMALEFLDEYEKKEYPAGILYFRSSR